MRLTRRRIEPFFRYFSTKRASATILFCVPGKEFVLTQELGRKLDVSSSDVQILKPGIIQIPNIDTDIPDLVFSLQSLPNGKFYSSPKEVELSFSETHIVTHAIVPKMLKGMFSRSAANNRCENILKTLTKHNVSPNRKFISPRQLSWYRDANFELMQVLSFDRDNLFVSLSSPKPTLFSHWPSLTVAGLNDIHHSLPNSPNSAFRKLQESFHLLGKFPKFDDKVIDLGGAPGGFASLFLSYGCEVLSIDKGKFEVANEKLFAKQGDAFELAPPFFPDAEQQVDWISWDVICTPAKFLESLNRICESKWTRNFLGMIKFQGEIDWTSIQNVYDIGSEHGYDVRVKHLFNNKNECACVLTAKED